MKMEQKKYKLELTEEEVNIVLQALGELPAKISLKVIQIIASQAENNNKN